MRILTNHLLCVRSHRDEAVKIFLSGTEHAWRHAHSLLVLAWRETAGSLKIMNMSEDEFHTEVNFVYKAVKKLSVS